MESYTERCVNDNDDRLNTVVKWKCKHDSSALYVIDIDIA